MTDDLGGSEQGAEAVADGVNAEAEQNTEETQQDDSAQDGEEVDAVGAEEYAPNTKYTVLDEEHEFDPKLHAVLSAETEPLIRELYERSHGLDGIKTKLGETRQERDQYRGSFEGLQGEVQRIIGYKTSGDLDSFFEALKMDPRDLAQYILQKAQIEQLPPEQKAVYTEREMLRRRMNVLENNFQSVNTQSEQHAVQARVAELDSTLSSPEYISVAGQFDQRNGKGSFRKAIMAHGASEYHTSKRDLSGKEAVASFVKTYGLEAPKPVAKPGAAATKRVVAKPKAKTIPNLGSSQASVTAEQKPKSLDDIKKYRQAKYGS